MEVNKSISINYGHFTVTWTCMEQENSFFVCHAMRTWRQGFRWSSKSVSPAVISSKYLHRCRFPMFVNLCLSTIKYILYQKYFIFRRSNTSCWDGQFLAVSSEFTSSSKPSLCRCDTMWLIWPIRDESVTISWSGSCVVSFSGRIP